MCMLGRSDMIAIPGDTKATTISGMIADEMAIGMINQKTTAVRLIPVIGKKVVKSHSLADCSAMRRLCRLINLTVRRLLKEAAEFCADS